MLNLRDSFYLLIRQYEVLYRLIYKMEQSNNLYLLGGAVRNYIENQYTFDPQRLPRDFDFVVEHKKGKNLDDIMQSLGVNIPVRYNGFGGYKLAFDDIHIDIWKMEDTWAFTHTSLKKCKDNLVKSVFLNIDGIVYDFHKNSYYTELYDSAIRNRKIGIVLKNNPKVHLNLLRALIFSDEYNMEISNQIKSMIQSLNQGQRDFIESLYDLQVNRYKKRMIPLAELKSTINDIEENIKMKRGEEMGKRTGKHLAKLSSAHTKKMLQEKNYNMKLQDKIDKGLKMKNASTGTPMNTLSGAARFTATLSNIGEGSKVTGGGGMEEGMKRLVKLAESNGKLDEMKENRIEETQDKFTKRHASAQELLP